MPKIITLEMLHAMTPDQRKTLHGNATRMDTQASRDVLKLLEQDDLMPAPKAPKKALVRRTSTARAKPAAGTAERKVGLVRQA